MSERPQFLRESVVSRERDAICAQSSAERKTPLRSKLPADNSTIFPAIRTVSDADAGTAVGADVGVVSPASIGFPLWRSRRKRTKNANSRSKVPARMYWIFCFFVIFIYSVEFKTMRSSSNCFCSTAEGAPIITSCAFLFIGKGMISRMELSPAISITMRSTPGAMPA